MGQANGETIGGKEEHDVKSPIIVLPKDPGLVQKLRAKLGEYQARLREQTKGMAEADAQRRAPYVAPEEVKMAVADTSYKIRVLTDLLRDGSVATHTLSEKLLAEDGNLSADDFENACSVINNYVTADGRGNEGGTGLS